MNENLVFAYARIVKRITKKHGQPRLSVKDPVRVFESQKVTSCWLIGGVNHGISADDFGRYQEVHGWNHRGTVNTVLLKFRDLDEDTCLDLLKTTAQLVGLIDEQE